MTKSRIPPSKWNSALSPPARSSVRMIRSPRVRNAVSRRRWLSVSYDQSPSSKISSTSGKNVTVVPVSVASPATSSSPVGSPRANDCL